MRDYVKWIVIVLLAIAVLLGVVKLGKWVRYDLTTPRYLNIEPVGEMKDIKVLQGTWNGCTKSIVTTSTGVYTVRDEMSGKFGATVYIATDRINKCKALRIGNGPFGNMGKGRFK